jgi:CheY-like chemotaxis protein
MSANRAPVFVFAEDDDEDWYLIQDCFSQSEGSPSLERVNNGQELLTRLKDSNKTTPDLVLLDLKMPLKNGHEALSEIREDPSLRHIPVVIMTASRSEADIFSSYYKGANSYIAKPITNANLALVRKYWGDLVMLPKRK